jgi:hypothetical protein
VGTRRNCRHEDHVAPFRFLADVLLGRVTDFIVWANRSGSKSYLAALITWVASSFKSQLETHILGGSLAQSDKVYKAMDEFWRSTGLQDTYLQAEPTKHLTTWRNLSSVSVLTASTRSTRGPHPQRLIMDEIDEMAEDVYISALSQPQSKAGHPSMLGKLSTNHRWGGMMDKAVAAARAAGTPFYKWCIWEALRSCRDYSCSMCKVSSFCPGTHMKEADGYYEIEDFIKKISDLNEMTLRVEWFCEKIGRSDLVYGQDFDESLHSPLDLPGFNESLPVLLSIDFGGIHPFSVGVWQQFSFGWVRVDEVYMANTTNGAVLEECGRRPWWKNVEAAVADPSRADLIKEWEDAGITVVPADNSVEAGLEAQRAALRPISGVPKIFVNRRCQAWLREVESYYEKNGRPVKENDHAMDETRYFCLWVLKPRHVRKGKIYIAGQQAGDAAHKEDEARLKTFAYTAAKAQDASQGPRSITYKRARPDDWEDERRPKAVEPPPAAEAEASEPGPAKSLGGQYAKRKGRIWR